MAITKRKASSNGGPAVLDELKTAAIAQAAQDIFTAPPAPPKRVPESTVSIEIKTFEARVRKIWTWARGFWWLYVAAFLVISTHLGLTVFQKESLLQQLQVFLQDRKEQAGILTYSLNERKQEVRQLVNRLRVGQQEIEFLEGSLQFLNQGFATDRKMGVILEELGRKVPRGIRLRGLSIDENRVKILGYTANRPLIDRFVRSLGRSPQFKDPQLISVDVYEYVRGIVTFEILC